MRSLVDSKVGKLFVEGVLSAPRLSGVREFKDGVSLGEYKCEFADVLGEVLLDGALGGLCDFCE